MNTKYYLGSTIVIYLAVLFCLMLVFAIFGNGHVRLTDWAPWFIAIISLSIVLDFKYGTYIQIKDGYIYRVAEFFLKKKLKVQDIKGISYQLPFKANNIVPAIYIYADLDDSSPIIEMSTTGFTRKTHMEVVTRLKEMNPSIELDEYADSLFKEGQNLKV